jgi:bifunctional non-homologous end joining protein LigD
VNLAPIIPVLRREAFDNPAFMCELKYDGFRAIADTITPRILSKKMNKMSRFDWLLSDLPAGFVFDGEIVALDDRGRPVFEDLLFGRRDPIYLPFDVLFIDGADVRTLPLNKRKVLLDKVVQRYGLQKTEPLIGEGRAVFRAACKLDLEGLIAKRLDDSYEPKTTWFKILNPTYSQKANRHGLFESRSA